jgi:hypothetical protein
MRGRFIGYEYDRMVVALSFKALSTNSGLKFCREWKNNP